MIVVARIWRLGLRRIGDSVGLAGVVPAMGSCIGRCLTMQRSPSSRGCDNYGLSRQGGGGGISLLSPNSQSRGRNEFIFLVDEKFRLANSPKRLLSRFIKSRKTSKKPVQNYVGGLLLPQSGPYSRLNDSRLLSISSDGIPLQCLDARSLLTKTRTSTPASSLDLEWEHETLPPSTAAVNEPSTSSWITFPPNDDDDATEPFSIVVTERNNNGQVNGAGHENGTEEAEWSRVSSSANSLEWDNHVDETESVSVGPEVDVDTWHLLSEIERLTERTLQETGRDLYSS